MNYREWAVVTDCRIPWSQKSVPTIWVLPVFLPWLLESLASREKKLILWNYPKIIINGEKKISQSETPWWVFSGAIHEMSATLEDGNLVEVRISIRPIFLGIGHFSQGSIIGQNHFFCRERRSIKTFEWKIQAGLPTSRSLGLISPIQKRMSFGLVMGKGFAFRFDLCDITIGRAVIQAHHVGIAISMWVNAQSD